MKPFDLRTERLLLDQPRTSDIDDIAEYCTDPLFERYVTTPWPYRREDAVVFVTERVPAGWAADTEYTWALRAAIGGPLLGVVGTRTGRHDIGYWLGTPHRGNGYMAEAVVAVVDWVFATRPVDRILWECIVGNSASAAVARRAGFAFTGSGPAHVPDRDGRDAPAWHAERRRDGAARSEWPAETLPAS